MAATDEVGQEDRNFSAICFGFSVSSALWTRYAFLLKDHHPPAFALLLSHV